MLDAKPVVVLDPGHGGEVQVGGSTPNRVVGPPPGRLLEKELTLDLARRTRAALGNQAEVALTRSSDTNLSLAERAALARQLGAAIFVSLHFNGSRDPRVRGTKAFVARQASPASYSLGEALSRAVADRSGGPDLGVEPRDLGVLLPDRQAPGTAACLLEVTFLSNTEEAARLQTDSYRSALTSAVATTIGRRLQEPAGEELAHGLEDELRRSRRGKDFYLVPARPGHYLAMTGGYQWGKRELIDLLVSVSEAWHSRYPDYPFGLGDMSGEAGQSIGHHSHRQGIDFDVYPFRKDGKRELHRHGFSKVQVLGAAGQVEGQAPPTTWQSELYDRAKTQELIELVIDTAAPGAINMVIFNDPQVVQAVGQSRQVRIGDDAALNPRSLVRVHDDHFHVRLNID